MGEQRPEVPLHLGQLRRIRGWQRWERCGPYPCIVTCRGVALIRREPLGGGSGLIKLLGMLDRFQGLLPSLIEISGGRISGGGCCDAGAESGEGQPLQ